MKSREFLANIGLNWRERALVMEGRCNRDEIRVAKCYPSPSPFLQWLERERAKGAANEAA